MKIERGRPAVLRITLSTYEMSALVAAARWVVEGAQGDLTEEAREHLRQVLANYDAATERSEGRKDAIS